MQILNSADSETLFNQNRPPPPIIVYYRT